MCNVGITECAQDYILYNFLHLGQFQMATRQIGVKTLLGEPKSVLARERLKAGRGRGAQQDLPLGLQEQDQAPHKQAGQKHFFCMLLRDGFN